MSAEVKRYYIKRYVDAVQYLGPEKTPVGMFQLLSNMNTDIDGKGRLQFYISTWEHIGVPLGYWLVIDHMAETLEQKYKVYNDEVFHKYFKEDI